MGKSGLPYVPLDVTLDNKFALIEAEFGIKGFGVIVKLFQEIYGGQGYYAEWTDEIALLFAKRIGVSEGAVSEIVKAAIRRGIFDKRIFDTYGVLTSHGIQERYLKGAHRRSNIQLKNEYLLLRNTELSKNVYITAGNVDISDENAYISEQVKENKGKEKECKENNTAGGGGRAAISLMENIKGMPLTEYEITRLMDMVDTYSEEWVLDALKIMGDNGKVKISYAEGILKNWQTDGKGKKSGSPFSAEAEAWFNRSDDDGEAGTARV